MDPNAWYTRARGGEGMKGVVWYACALTRALCTKTMLQEGGRVAG